MRIIRTCSLGVSAVLAVSLLAVVPASAAVTTEMPTFTFADFSDKWADKFEAEGVVVKTENTYRSHDLNITIDRFQSDRLTGDVDENGKVEIADAVAAAQYAAECALSITETGTLNADIDEDGTVTLMDNIQILRYLGNELTDEEFLVEHSLTYHIVDFYVRSIECFRAAFAYDTYQYPDESSKLEKIPEMAARQNAVLAINRDLYKWRSGGNSIVLSNGIVYREGSGKANAVFYDNGEMDILTDAEYRALSDEERSHLWQISHFGPPLVWDGEVINDPATLKQYTSVSIEAYEPRTAVGYYEPGHYCFIQVDGRRPGYSWGMTLPQLADLADSLGCAQVFGMDGGSSSNLVFLGENYNIPAPVHVGGTSTRPDNSDIFYLVDRENIVPDLAAEKFIAEQQAAAAETTTAE